MECVDLPVFVVPALNRGLDRAVGASVYELVDMVVAAIVDDVRRAVPDDLAFEQHGDVVGNLAG